jgi:hypothetical protein
MSSEWSDRDLCVRLSRRERPCQLERAPSSPVCGRARLVSRHLLIGLWNVRRSGRRGRCAGASHGVAWLPWPGRQLLKSGVLRTSSDMRRCCELYRRTVSAGGGACEIDRLVSFNDGLPTFLFCATRKRTSGRFQRGAVRWELVARRCESPVISSLSDRVALATLPEFFASFEDLPTVGGQSCRLMLQIEEPCERLRTALACAMPRTPRVH